MNTNKLEHFNNLVYMAFADGVLDEEEINFLAQKAEEFDITATESENIIAQASNIQFIIPEDEDEREEQFSDFVCLMMIDGDIHEKEYQLCMSVAEKLEFTKSDLDDVIDLTKKLWEQKNK